MSTILMTMNMVKTYLIEAVTVQMKARARALCIDAVKLARDYVFAEEDKSDSADLLEQLNNAVTQLDSLAKWLANHNEPDARAAKEIVLELKVIVNTSVPKLFHREKAIEKLKKCLHSAQTAATFGSGTYAAVMK